MAQVIIRANWRILHDGQEFPAGAEAVVDEAVAAKLGAACAVLGPAPEDPPPQDPPADDTKPARKAKG